jgi:hypothetical protein
MTIIFSLRSADFQYFENYLREKWKEKALKKTKIDFFVLTKRSLLISVSRVLVIRKTWNSWVFSSLQILSSLQISSSLQILDCRWSFDCKFLFDCKWFCVKWLLTVVLCSLCRREAVVENEDIRLFEKTLLNSEFEELLFVVRKNLFVQKDTW